jgi:thiol-disulfide isomerase/thioredoxin
MESCRRITIALVLLGPILGCEKSTGEPPKPGPTSAAAPKTETQSAGPTFHDLPFAEACAKAKETGKLVLVDFYTTWCMPCKQLDKVTWHDAAVETWLRAKTVAIKVDAEKQRELAARYSIGAYPTIVFMEPDGKEKGRIIGFQPPKDFLAQAADVLAGITRADRLREDLKAGGENDPMKRQALGDELARQGKSAEALEHYLWCFDHGNEHGPGYAGVRLSLLPSSIVQLGQTHPPALVALRERRDKATAAVLEGAADRLLALEASALNRALGDEDQTLTLFDRLLKERHAESATVLPMLCDQVLDALVAAQRYQDILDAAGPVNVKLSSEIAGHRMTEAHFKDEAESPVAYLRTSLLEKGGKYYEALLGVKDTDHATELIEQLLGVDETADTFALLVRHAVRAGDSESARALMERGVKSVPEEQRPQLARAVDEARSVLLMDKYLALVAENATPEGADSLGQEVAGALSTDAERLNDFAWRVLTDEKIKFRDRKLALRVAKAAYDASEGKNAAIIDTYARALWDTGSKPEAIEQQRKAVQLATDDDGIRAELEQTLARYEAASGE